MLKLKGSRTRIDKDQQKRELRTYAERYFAGMLAYRQRKQQQNKKGKSNG